MNPKALEEFMHYLYYRGLIEKSPEELNYEKITWEYEKKLWENHKYRPHAKM